MEFKVGDIVDLINHEDRWCCRGKKIVLTKVRKLVLIGKCSIDKNQYGIHFFRKSNARPSWSVNDIKRTISGNTTRTRNDKKRASVTKKD